MSIEEAVIKYSDMLYKICIVMLCNEQDTQDVIQDTFCKYLERKNPFANEEHEKAWLITVATNNCRNILNFRVRHPKVPIEKLAETLVAPGEELLSWLDSDINGYCVTNLYLLEDGRLCATVGDWRNEDRAIVVLTRTKAEEAPQRENLMLATVDGESDLAAMAVKFNRGSSRHQCAETGFSGLF